ncbi:MAG: hypothetical protein NTY57_06900 [Solirubrobacterales bacterium]|nr:hypothetical protein [Solirubrobacterales bacterium]
MLDSVIARVAVVFLIAAAVWKLPGGGTAASVVWEALGAGMLALIAWSVWRFGKEHWLELDRLGEQGRLVLYGSIALLLLTLAAKSLLWQTSPGSVLWLLMAGGVVAGAYRSWQLWREL